MIYKTETKYQVRRAVVLVGLVLAITAVVSVALNLWWVGGDVGYCWGSSVECYGLGK